PVPPRESPGGGGAERIVRTGFPALDAILGPGGLPRSASVALRGEASSGKTTLALRLAAEAQVDGAIVAWLDLARSLDPVEAVARGIRLDWLVVLTPETLDEGLSIAGALLAGRSIDLLVVDLPPRPDPGTTAARVADRLRRLAALARRSETLLVALESPGLSAGLVTAVAESTGLRLELARRSWIRLGRDVVGQRTEVTVARNRFGPPGRRAELRILYAEGGERDRCLARDDLLRDDLLRDDLTAAPTGPLKRIPTDASSPPLLATSPHPARQGAPLRLLPDGPAGRPRRTTLDGRDGHRRGPGRTGARRPAGDPARERPPARA
ncbi:MAG: DNA recombination/repair protein RecA, partial [Chloroflexota bacterium]|nr:DNA recombination/repair protein RecA [Chloroflexota bacterium]